MKVKDIMQKDVIYVSPKTYLKEVSKLIFGHGINGVPVCRGKKLIGMITERDILSQFFPTMQEYVEDYVHVRDFEKMEEKAKEILTYPAEKIMSKNITTVTPNTPLLRAQSLMFVSKVGRLPVVDENDNLVGLVAKGDIFRAVVGQRLPFEEEQGYYDWLARHYDILIDWKKRLANEIPDLIKLFNKEKAKKILDIAFGTGEHDIALAKRGFEIVGLESSSLMHEISDAKIARLGKNIKDKISYHDGIYKNMLGVLSKDFDAAIFLGNTLPHVMVTDKDILKRVLKILNPKKYLLVFQIINFGKLFKKKGGLRDFYIRESNFAYEQRHAFVGFYSKGKGKKVIASRAIFDLVGEKWVFKGINSTHILHIEQKEIEAMLKALGFSKILFYGGMYNGPLFKNPFKPLKSDWLNIVAIR